MKTIFSVKLVEDKVTTVILRSWNWSIINENFQLYFLTVFWTNIVHRYLYLYLKCKYSYKYIFTSYQGIIVNEDSKILRSITERNVLAIWQFLGSIFLVLSAFSIPLLSPLSRDQNCNNMCTLFTVHCSLLPTSRWQTEIVSYPALVIS